MITTNDKVYDLTKEIVNVETELKKVSTNYREKIKSEESFIRKLSTMEKDSDITSTMVKAYLKLRTLKDDLKTEVSNFKGELNELYEEINHLLNTR